MPLKLLFSLLALTLLAACTKKLEQPITKEEETKPAPVISSFILPPGGTTVVIHFENGKQLQAYQKDGAYYVEGDIALLPRQIEQLKKLNSTSSRSVLNSYINHWKNGKVPYVINGAFSLNDKNTILNAIYNWETNTTLNFIERTAANAANYPDYVEFVPAWGNTANIGKTGGIQYIQLLVDPVYGVHLTSATHEIGHVLGYFHEQSRVDRDEYITINWSNIQPSAQFNFLTWNQQGLTGIDLGTFDFNSIMLYPSYVNDPGFVLNPDQPAMQKVDGSTWYWNFVLSPGDIETANFIYGPPYARLEYSNVSNSSVWSWTVITEHVEDNVFVRLYADEQCTIPYSTPVDKNVELLYTENINGSTRSEITTAFVPAGRNGVLVRSGLVSRDYRVEWGAVKKNETRKFEAHSAFFRNQAAN